MVYTKPTSHVAHLNFMIVDLATSNFMNLPNQAVFIFSTSRLLVLHSLPHIQHPVVGESLCARSDSKIDLGTSLCVHIQLSSSLMCWSSSLTCLGFLTKFCNEYLSQGLFCTTQQKAIICFVFSPHSLCS